MFVKLRGYGSNRGNDEPSNYSQRPCRILLRDSFRGLKIASRRLLILQQDAAGGSF